MGIGERGGGDDRRQLELSRRPTALGPAASKMNDMLLDMGARALANLPTRAAEIQELMQSNFQKTTLAEMQTQFETLVASSPGSVNASVVGLSTLVREQAALTVEDIKSLEMYLAIKTPEVSDGNNFGVEVQSFVLSELKGCAPRLCPCSVPSATITVRVR